MTNYLNIFYRCEHCRQIPRGLKAWPKCEACGKEEPPFEDSPSTPFTYFVIIGVILACIIAGILKPLPEGSL